MARSISSGIGRIWIMSLIAVFFVGSFLTFHLVFGRGAISSENQSNAILKIVSFYVPLLTLIATFYFTENRRGMRSNTPLEAFIVALVIVSIWAATPVMLFLSVYYIEDNLSYIDKLIPVGQSLALMALGYYFAKKPASR